MSAFPSIIAMKHSPKHFDDLNIAHRPTLREKLNASLLAAENGMKQTDFPEIVERSALRAANIKTQLWLLDRIEFLSSRIA